MVRKKVKVNRIKGVRGIKNEAVLEMLKDRWERAKAEWKEVLPNKEDKVNHPSHYNSHPSGVECITITRWMNFNKGNAMKYIWRAGESNLGVEKEVEDLKKARWYLEDEIKRLGGTT